MNKARVTFAFMGLNIFSYFVLAYLSKDPLEINRLWMIRFGLNKEAFLQGAYWQILTNLFVHFDLPHLGYNMIFLFFFGAKCEDIYGEKTYLGLYLFCGIVSSLVAFIYPIGAISAGSSGAIYGVLGASLVAQRNLYPSGMLTSLIYGTVFFLLAAATGFLAHLIGLIAGFSAGFLVTKNWYPEEEEIDDLDYGDWIFQE